MRQLGNRHRPRDPRAARDAARKIFSGSPTAYGAAPNTQANLVDLGYPGVLPVLNGEAVRMAVKFGLAIGAHDRARARCSRARTTSIRTCRRATRSASTSCRSSRRARSTSCSTTARTRRIGITRAHLEEDAGKSLHEGLAEAVRHRPEPRRHAAARDRLRARHALGEGSRRLHARRCTRWCATSRSATATCRKARSAATPTSRCAASGARSSARAPRSRTSTRSASSRRRSTTKSRARSS